MTLGDILEALDELSPDELRELSPRIDKLKADRQRLRAGTMNVDALPRAAEQITEGMTDE